MKSLVHGRYALACREFDERDVISRGAVYQEDGVIVAVGPYEQLRARYQPDEEIGGSDFLLLPGLVNAHHHGVGVTSLQMGFPDDELEPWIFTRRALRPVDRYLDSLYSAVRLLEGGVTSVVHSHTARAPGDWEAPLEATLRAFKASGLRFAFALNARDQNFYVYGPEGEFLSSLDPAFREQVLRLSPAPRIGVDEYLSLFDRLRGDLAGSRIGLLFGPMSQQWCSDEFLARLSQRARELGTGVHLHLSETWRQQAYAQRTFGCTQAQHLDRIGFWGSYISCAHAVWLTREDVELMAGKGAVVTHQPSSNLRLRSGVAPVLGMLRAGLRVAMGTDGTTLDDNDDLLAEMGLALRLHRPPGTLAPLSSWEVLRMATASGASIAGMPAAVGSLEPGRRADLVLIDLREAAEPYFEDFASPVDLLLYRLRSRHVDTVIVDGEPLMRGRRLLHLDHDALMAELRQGLERQAPASSEIREFASRLAEQVRAYYADWPAPPPSPWYSLNAR